MTPSHRVGAVLLAAGGSLRMGRPKGLLPWGGRSLLEHQIGALLNARVAVVAVVLGADADALAAAAPDDPRVRVVWNARHRTGRSSSLVLGVLAMRAMDDLLICNLDQPLSDRLLNDLLEGAWGRPEGPIVLPAFGGRRGHPALIRATVYPEALSVAERTEGLRAVIRRDPARVLQVETTSANALAGFNTPLEYAEAMERAARGELDLR